MLEQQMICPPLGVSEIALACSTGMHPEEFNFEGQESAPASPLERQQCTFLPSHMLSRGQAASL